MNDLSEAFLEPLAAHPDKHGNVFDHLSFAILFLQHFIDHLVVVLVPVVQYRVQSSLSHLVLGNGQVSGINECLAVTESE